jgi:hypothetical protein
MQVRRATTIAAIFFIITMSVMNAPSLGAGDADLRSVSLSFDENLIPLISKVIDIRKEPTLTAVPSRLRGDPYAYYIVHFTQAPTADMAFGEFVSPIVYGSYIMRMSPQELERTAASKYVDWIGEYKTEYKIDPEIYREASRLSASYQEGTKPESYSPERDEFVVKGFMGEDGDQIERHIRGVGAEVLQRASDRLFVRTDISNLSNIAALVGVQWVAKAYRMIARNDNGTWITQTYVFGNRKIFENGLTGSDQIVAVSDTGLDADHLMFWDPSTGLPSHDLNPSQRKVFVYYNWYQTGVLVGSPPYYSPGDGYYPAPGDPKYNVYDWDFNRGHGTHVAGTVAGEWPTGITLPTSGRVTTSGYDYYEGNAFDARLVIQDLSRRTSQYIYPPPDLNDYNPPDYGYPGSVGLFPQAMDAGAYIHTNSWGGGGFQSYDSYSQDVDEMMWSNPEFLIIFSNGNDGPGAGTITPPATAKNCISVGAAETSNDGYGHNSENVAYFSSWGPTDYWTRVKPDVVAPGYYIFSARNNDVTDGSSPNDGLVAYAGTSTAAPAVAGAAALVREYFTENWYTPVGASTAFLGAGAFTPSAALVKAVIINSAQPMTGKNTGGTIPGNGQGWGRLLLDNALYFAGDRRSLLVDDYRSGLDSEGVAGPTLTEYTVAVGPGEPLDVTLAYTDPPGAAGSAAQMVNYLYLEVNHPNGVDYYLSGDGNFEDGESVPNTGLIFPDVVQKVRVNNPDPGVYRVRVRAYSTDQVHPGWNLQPYALAVSGNLVQSEGYVEFDRYYYPAAGPLGVTLADADLAGAGTAAVVLTSAGTGDSEAATLDEVNSPSGVFSGILTSDPVAGGSPNDGILKVTDPDTLTATYNDASPPGLRTDTARIDSVPPAISDVAVKTCNGQSVEITWTTDESANSVVHWGTTPSYGSTVSNLTMTTSHLVEFDGLNMGALYYHEVCSTDEPGNARCSGPYNFTTPEIFTPPKNHAGYVAEYTLGVVLDYYKMPTGHDSAYGTRHGVFQFDLTSLPTDVYITSVQLIIFKHDDQLNPNQQDVWSSNLIDFDDDLRSVGTYQNVHNAPVLVTMSPTWSSAQLESDAPGTAYPQTISDRDDLAYFNPDGHRADRLTFRLDGAATGSSVMSWDTGYRQDLGSLGVCYKPALTITYGHAGVLEFNEGRYEATGPLTITLNDADLTGAGEVNVMLTSERTGDSETAKLTEVNAPSGVFKGSFPCDTVSGVLPNDGILNVADRDKVTATYYDENPQGVREATALIGSVSVGGIVTAVDKVALASIYVFLLGLAFLLPLTLHRIFRVGVVLVAKIARAKAQKRSSCVPSGCENWIWPDS